MQIEQTRPNKPNFKLIVIIFAFSIVVFLVLGILFVKHNAKHIEPSGRATPASSRIALPLPLHQAPLTT